MVTDERIIRSRNDIAAQGFWICIYALGAALLYRQLYLGQHPREYWDLALALFVSAGYVNLVCHARGATRAQGERGSSFPRVWWRIGRIILIMVLFNLLRGRIGSSSELWDVLLSGALVVPPAALLFYLLDGKWKTRSGLTE